MAGRLKQMGLDHRWNGEALEGTTPCLKHGWAPMHWVDRQAHTTARGPIEAYSIVRSRWNRR